MNAHYRLRRMALAIALAGLLSSTAIYAHTYVGVEHGPTLVRARVQSPNGSVTDLPIPIPDTDLSVVCFRVRNAGLFDSRITAIGFELPGDSTGFALVSPTDAGFHLIEDVTNVPGLPDVTLDFAIVTGRTFGGGRPHAGLPPSSTLTTFCVSGPFPRDLAIEHLIDRGVVRVQRVGADGELGDIAVWENRPL